MLLNEIKELRDKSKDERNDREDNRWVASYYHGLQDFKVGQHIWHVGTVGEKCDNRIWEEIITGEMKVNDLGGYLNFATKNEEFNVTIWNRFNSIGCSIFFTKEEAENVLNERLKEVFKK